MQPIRMANGNLLVTVPADQPGGSDRIIEIELDHPEYEKWNALAEGHEGPVRSGDKELLFLIRPPENARREEIKQLSEVIYRHIMDQVGEDTKKQPKSPERNGKPRGRKPRPRVRGR